MYACFDTPRFVLSSSRLRRDEYAILAPVLCCSVVGWFAGISLFGRRARPLRLHRACSAGELARFACTEYADRDWPRMPVGYDVSFPRGKARPGNIRLVDDQGVEQPIQLAAIKTHGDGSIQSCRVHFYAALTAGGSCLHHLETGKRASGGKKGVTDRRRRAGPGAVPASVRETVASNQSSRQRPSDQPSYCTKAL
jgi:hypothetical protein